MFSMYSYRSNFWVSNINYGVLHNYCNTDVLISVVNSCYCVIVIEEHTSSEKLDVSVGKQRILTVYNMCTVSQKSFHLKHCNTVKS